MNLFSALLVEDQEIVREGLSLILKKHFPNVQIYQASNGQEAMDILKSTPITIVLLDIGLPGMSGVEVAQLILNTYPLIKVLVVTQYNGEAMIRNLFKAGVHSFFFKNNASSEIKEAITTVLAGNQYIPESLQFTLKPTGNVPSIVFTRREAQILLLLKMGRSSREISERLNLKENTINSYREEMLQKTKSNNVAQLISFAYENGII